MLVKDATWVLFSSILHIPRHRCDVISSRDSKFLWAVLSLPVLESVHYVKQEKKPFEEGRAEETCKVALLTIQPANLGFILIS